MSTPTITRPDSVHLPPGSWPLGSDGTGNILTEEDLLNVATTRSEQIFDDFSSGQSECAICYEEISAQGKVWSCCTCFQVYHHECIAGWSERHANTGDWPCPTCKSPVPQEETSSASCWCGKRRHSVLDLMGNTCGESCLKANWCDRKRCMNRCQKPCHPGPCGTVVCASDCATKYANVTVRPRKPAPARTYPPTNQTREQRRAPTSGQRAYHERSTSNDEAVAGAFAAAFCSGVPIGIVNITLLWWGFQRAKWWSQPLSYQHFTENLQSMDYRGSLAAMIVGSGFLTLFSAGFCCALGSGLIRKYGLGLAHNRPGRKFITVTSMWILWFFLSFSVMIVLNEAPRAAWRNQFENTCSGFDTLVHLDNEDCMDKAYCLGRPSSTLTLRRKIRLDTQHRTLPILGNFTLASQTDSQNLTRSSPFFAYRSITGYLDNSNYLTIDYDLINHAYRVHSSLTKTSTPTIISNGTWTPTTHTSPHALFPSLQLSVPNLFLFTRDCHYQPFFTVSSTLNQTSPEIASQAARRWSKHSAFNVVMRTSTPYGGPEGLDACLKIDTSKPFSAELDGNGKGIGELGVGTEGEMGRDLLIPLGLMAVLRKEMQAQGRYDEACSFA